MIIERPTKHYRLDDLPVFFYGESCLDIIKSVLDEKGNIRNFPGFAPDDSWKEKQRIGICKDVRHEAQFYAMPNEEYLML